jgi:uncharacterized membrane protein YphA (DoxX/SURF4 family)
MFDKRLNTAWWVLRIGFGVGPILAGLDKYFNILTQWTMYLSPLVPRFTHLKPETFMHIVGLVEIAAGILVLTRYTRVAAYIVMFWLLGIAANLLTTGMFLDIAVRDVEVSLGVFALAKLTEVRQSVAVQSPKAKSVKYTATQKAIA